MAFIRGNSLANKLYGTNEADYIDGSGSLDTLIGGLGNDIYVVDDLDDYVLEEANAGIDTVFASTSFSLYENIENLTLLGNTNIVGNGNQLANVITGNTGNNALAGGDGADTLIGGAGDDRFFGDAGADKLFGGAGNDEYIMRLTVAGKLEDTATENANEGIDTLLVQNLATLSPTAVLNFTLANHFEYIYLDDGITNASKITGNGVANIIRGGSGNDTLSGGVGIDSLAGGFGNDTYIVDNNVIDVIEELDGQGVDSVQISMTNFANYQLGSFIENAVLTNKINFSIIGNASDNKLTGNAAINTLVGNDGNDLLYGLAGGDSLYGGDGDDLLDGGAGVDRLDGGDGNDTYIIDSLLDIIVEGNGVDTVIVNTSVGKNYTLAAEIENLSAMGTAAINLTGNDSDNTIGGNAGNNSINGGIGADYLAGEAGNDTLIGGDGVDTLEGGAGNDILDGGSLSGDVYVFKTALNIAGIDTIKDFDNAYIELSLSVFTSLTGLVGGNVNADQLLVGNFTSGQDADDFIIYNNTTGKLYYDADGSGAIAAKQFALVQDTGGGVSITLDIFNDFVLVA